ncbi:gamma-glutamyltranspeptidase / glutathione hydrolase [Nitrosomonas aestuarii]|uniref:Glutathione hydrolase proenzyme n=1 Tax=Nitrosomonas aestuarii TaxID=52441 RepID=A0A1I4A906_9PROT|nr:gamma-glutamyltransferase [Nitrosomonas aestuarii]SFK52269.1 gamma-glutamyltranspeptidase / glutathione hydrolase [Nitrosomonas aestuarii]
MFTNQFFNKKPIHAWLLCLFFVFGFFADRNYANVPAAVVSAHPLATAAGTKILNEGGNAFDAAVAVSAVLAVVEPYASGLGGGGFWLLHNATNARDIMIDGREIAPLEASEHMYLNRDGQPIPGKSLNGPIAAGIPGTPAALVHLTQNFGQLTLAQNLKPAIQLARDGFKVDQRFARTLRYHEKKLAQYPDTAKIFLPDGKLPVAGDWFRQPQLAGTLNEIAKSGMNGFYHGSVAKELVHSVRKAGGVWREQDLYHYKIVAREPVQFEYRNTRITTASLPSAGGLTLAQAFNILEYLPLDKDDSDNQAHLITEILRLTYKDRIELLGDSDFDQVPAKKLLSKGYAREQAALIDPEQAGKSILKQSIVNESVETTHFSIIDKAGNRVAATMSINTFFGSGFVAGNTGILLNNEMDDFSKGRNIPNIFGLYGSHANMIAPGKRPLSSMSPTFVENDKGILIVGTPGGSRIISMLFLVILDYINNNQMDPQKLVEMPRFHHQYLPDFIQVEPDAFDPGWIASLQAKGHEVRIMSQKWGNMQLILFDKENQQTRAASDPRGLSDTHY